MAPQFFKVFHPDLCSHQMNVCSTFKTHLEATGEATLERNASKKTWTIVLEEENGEFFFRGGWKEFSIDNGLQSGEFMVFQYNGDLNFTVDLYGTDGCERGGYSNNLDNDGTHDNVNGDDDGNDEVEEDKVEYNQRRKGVQVAKWWYTSISNIPQFMVKISPTYVKLGILHLPIKFVEKFMTISKPLRVNLCIEGEVWRVKVYSYQTKRQPLETYWKLGKGFGKFVDDNGIKPGDVCVFEAKSVPCEEFQASLDNIMLEVNNFEMMICMVLVTAIVVVLQSTLFAVDFFH